MTVFDVGHATLPCLRPVAMESGKSATAKRVHNLHHIAFLQRIFGMLRARDDFAIDLYRHAALAQAFGLQQLMQGEGSLQLAGFAIELDIHGSIFATSWQDFICAAT